MARTRWLKATQVLDRWLVADRQALEGLAIPLQTQTASGLLLLCDIDGLSIDQIDVGRQVAAAIESHIQRHALLAMVKQTAVTGARASLSRDLHDSIVQFLAGATLPRRGRQPRRPPGRGRRCRAGRAQAAAAGGAAGAALGDRCIAQG